MLVASRLQGEALARSRVPGLGGHRAVRMVGMMVIVQVVGMVVAKGC